MHVYDDALVQPRSSEVKVFTETNVIEALNSSSRNPALLLCFFLARSSALKLHRMRRLGGASLCEVNFSMSKLLTPAVVASWMRALCCTHTLMMLKNSTAFMWWQWSHEIRPFPQLQHSISAPSERLSEVLCMVVHDQSHQDYDSTLRLLYDS
eukprot:113062-Amphidinium_carterae.2